MMFIKYIYVYLLSWLATESTVDSRSLDKVLLLCQKNSIKLDRVVKKQDQLETMINEQKDKINEILSKFEKHDDTEFENSKKGKNKSKDKTEFYQVNILLFIIISLCCLYFNYQIDLYYRKRFENWHTSCFTNTNK